MRFAHLTGRERPLAVTDGHLVAALEDLDGMPTVDALIAAGPGAWDAARAAAPAALERGEPLAPGMLEAPSGPLGRSPASGSTTTTTAARPAWRHPSAR